jgi:exopolysaccharide production protein ExoZ
VFKIVNKQEKLFLLQYIRALAASLVVLFHASIVLKEYYHQEFLGDFFKVGYMGVDLFFVLSGFIIFYIHHKDIGLSSKFNTFSLKRIIRVYPSYWIILLAIIPIYFIAPSFGNGNETELKQILTSFFLLPNSDGTIITVAWTLKQEILFYLFFAVFFILIPNGKKIISTFFVIIWAITTILLTLLNIESNNTLVNYIFNPMNLEFLFGGVVAYLILNKKYSLKGAFIFSIVGIILFLVSWYLSYMHSFEAKNIYRVMIWGVPSTIIIFSLIAINLSKQLNLNKLFIFVGDASYSIYLTHFLALSFISKVFIKFHVNEVLGIFITGVITIVLCMIIGCLYYKIIERPLLRFFRKYLISKKTKIKQNTVIDQKI